MNKVDIMILVKAIFLGLMWGMVLSVWIFVLAQVGKEAQSKTIDLSWSLGEATFFILFSIFHIAIGYSTKSILADLAKVEWIE